MMAKKRGFADLHNTDACLSARVLIAEYGADAESLASVRIAEMQEINNVSGVVTWSRILAAIQGIQSTEGKASAGRRQPSPSSLS